METLKLTIDKQWFDLIKSGTKTEEYREIKKHWIQRIIPNLYNRANYKFENEIIENIVANPEYFEQKRIKKFDFVEFTNGYSRASEKITMKCLGISIGLGKERWGATPNTHYFIIKLGNREPLNQ